MGSKLKKNSWLELLGQLISVFSKLAQLGLIKGGDEWNMTKKNDNLGYLLKKKSPKILNLKPFESRV